MTIPSRIESELAAPFRELSGKIMKAIYPEIPQAPFEYYIEPALAGERPVLYAPKPSEMSTLEQELREFGDLYNIAGSSVVQPNEDAGFFLQFYFLQGVVQGYLEAHDHGPEEYTHPILRKLSLSTYNFYQSLQDRQIPDITNIPGFAQEALDERTPGWDRPDKAAYLECRAEQRVHMTLYIDKLISGEKFDVGSLHELGYTIGLNMHFDEWSRQAVQTILSEISHVHPAQVQFSD